MTEQVIHTIGPGQRFETLAQWASALPHDLVAAGQHWVAEVQAHGEDPGGIVIRAACDADHHVEIRAAAGHGFAALTDPLTDPVAPSLGLGATVRCLSGDALRAEGDGTLVVLHGLQVIAEDGAAIADDERGAVTRLDSCLCEAVSAGPAVTVRGSESAITASGIIQRGCGDGLVLAEGANAEAVTVLKPARTIADGIGVMPTGLGRAEARSVVAFGFRQAFGYGLVRGPGLVCDQINVLGGPENFADPAWTAIGGSVDPLNTRPGPFAVPLRWLGNHQNGSARFEQDAEINLAPGETFCFSALVAEPTALSSGLVLDSPCGQAALTVRWIDTPASTSLAGHREGLAAVDGGQVDLGGGCTRIWLVAQNRTGTTLPVRPVFQITAGIENAGLNLGIYAGCVMAGPGHLGTGFTRPDALYGVACTGVDPDTALRSASSILPDLRPVEGGPLDAPCHVSSRDLLGRRRMAPETLGAVALHPAPRFVAEPVRPPEVAPRRAAQTEERPCS